MNQSKIKSLRELQIQNLIKFPMKGKSAFLKLLLQSFRTISLTKDDCINTVERILKGMEPLIEEYRSSHE